MKKFTKIGTGTALVGAIVLGGAVAANAHGFVGNDESDVVTRAAMKANGDMGPIQWEPQSIEGPKGFSLDPATGGPADGKLASAGNTLAAALDAQSPERWVENEVEAGQTLNIGWKYTASHQTTRWHYYITKNGWDQNSPLTCAQLQPLTEITQPMGPATNTPSHKVKLPADHTGDHVILAVWDVADTANAFYNVIDIHIDGDGAPETPDTIAPSAPSNVHVMNVTDKGAEIMWSASTDNVGVDRYEIQRAVKGGEFQTIGSTAKTTHLDTGLKASTTYEYKVVAFDAAGNASAASKVFTVTTKADTNPGPVDPTVKPWSATGAYKKGDRVSHNGSIFEALQDHRGYGDPNWIDAVSLWKKVS